MSLYLGTTRPVRFSDIDRGELGIEQASWKPPHLESYEFVYYLGSRDGSSKLACSCLLLEQVEWTDAGAIVRVDDLDGETTPCPFDTLRALCDEATRDGGFATLVSDDSGGQEQRCSREDYCMSLVRLGSIARGNLLFTEVSGSIPWRVLHVVR
jgi:hypothetical protein